MNGTYFSVTYKIPELYDNMQECQYNISTGCGLLGCDTMQSRMQIPVFLQNVGIDLQDCMVSQQKR